MRCRHAPRMLQAARRPAALHRLPLVFSRRAVVRLAAARLRALAAQRAFTVFGFALAAFYHFASCRHARLLVCAFCCALSLNAHAASAAARTLGLLKYLIRAVRLHLARCARASRCTHCARIAVSTSSLFRYLSALVRARGGSPRRSALRHVKAFAMVISTSRIYMTRHSISPRRARHQTSSGAYQQT